MLSQIRRLVGSRTADRSKCSVFEMNRSPDKPGISAMTDQRDVDHLHPFPPWQPPPYNHRAPALYIAYARCLDRHDCTLHLSTPTSSHRPQLIPGNMSVDHIGLFSPTSLIEQEAKFFDAALKPFGQGEQFRIMPTVIALGSKEKPWLWLSNFDGQRREIKENDNIQGVHLAISAKCKSPPPPPPPPRRAGMQERRRRRAGLMMAHQREKKWTSSTRLQWRQEVKTMALPVSEITIRITMARSSSARRATMSRRSFIRQRRRPREGIRAESSVSRNQCQSSRA